MILTGRACPMRVAMRASSLGPPCYPICSPNPCFRSNRFCLECVTAPLGKLLHPREKPIKCWSPPAARGICRGGVAFAARVMAGPKYTPPTPLLPRSFLCGGAHVTQECACVDPCVHSQSRFGRSGRRGLGRHPLARPDARDRFHHPPRRLGGGFDQAVHEPPPRAAPVAGGGGAEARCDDHRRIRFPRA